MGPKSLEKQIWYWGKEDKEIANQALEHCLNGTFLVRQSACPPHQTLHVVDKGVVKLVRILVSENGVGLSDENMNFKSVVEVIENYGKVSLAHHNKNLNVRLTNPLPKQQDDDIFDESTEDDTSWSVYVKLYLMADIRMKEKKELSAKLAEAQEAAQRLSYQTTALHMVVEMFREQQNLKSTAITYLSNEYKDFIRDNFKLQEAKWRRVEEELERTSHLVTETQERVRELSLAQDELQRKTIKLSMKMDWHERTMRVEGINKEMILCGIAPFTQNLNDKILVRGIEEMWFVGEMNGVEAEKLLAGKANGTFMVRLNNEHNYVLSVVNKDKSRHIRVQGEGHRFWLKNVKKFDSVEELVSYFQGHCLGEQDRDFDTCLRYPVYMPEGMCTEGM